MARSLKSNFLFNLLYQLLLLIVPFITAPYLSRVLTVSGIGINSYSLSMATFFSLFAVLGSSTFAERSIGSVQDDPEQRTQVFWDVLAFRAISTCICLVAYLVYAFSASSNSDDRLVYGIYSLVVINTFFDISWFFQGMEDFKRVSLRNSIVKLWNVAFIFIFVHHPEDLWIYVLGYTGFLVLGSLWMWLFLPPYVLGVRRPHPFRNLHEMFLLFLPWLAIQLFTVLDKALIGWITNDSVQNGLYNQADMVVRMCLTLVTSLGIVMLPRVAHLHASGDREGVLRYISRSFRFTWFACSPIVFGLMAVAPVFVPVFFGHGYEDVVFLLPILAPLCIASGLSGVLGTQYFIPTKQQNYYTAAVVIAAVVNILICIALIRSIGAFGAAIASVSAEFCETIVLLFFVRKSRQFELRRAFDGAPRYLLCSAVMFGVVTVLRLTALSSVEMTSLLALVLAGGLFYAGEMLLLRDSMAMAVFSFVTSFLSRKKGVSK